MAERRLSAWRHPYPDYVHQELVSFSISTQSICMFNTSTVCKPANACDLKSSPATSDHLQSVALAARYSAVIPTSRLRGFYGA
jgi:hypothetical protein